MSRKALKLVCAFMLLAFHVQGNPVDPEKSDFKCFHYTDTTPTKEDPCVEPEHFDENGKCNMTNYCQAGDGPLKSRKNHCYSAWRVIDGEIKIARAGCWIPSDMCIDNTTCKAENGTANSGVYTCCCSEPMCNKQVFIVPRTHFPDFDNKETTEEEMTFLKGFLYILLPLLLIAVLVVVCFYCYRQRKIKYKNVESLSIVTPTSATTQCTTDFQPAELTLPQLIDLRARGRFGSVWKATYNGTIVAVKTFEPSVKNSWQTEKDIFNTPLLHNHENILKFIGTASQGSGIEQEFWLISEFHENGSLTDYLKGNVMTAEVALKIMETMSRGLSFLHEDIVSVPVKSEHYKPAIAHRDFKSKNVLLDRNLNAVIADFGLAVKFEPNQCPGDSHGQVGTLRYMAPEVLEGAITFQRDAFLRIDIYAFALVLWEIVTRCEAEEDWEVEKYTQPYENELGIHITIDVMTENVVEKKLRPPVYDNWRVHDVFATICETMEECWDNDAEARLSAGCVEERIRELRKRLHLADQSNNRYGEIIPTDSTERMNRRNIEMMQQMDNDDESLQKNLVEEEVQRGNGSLSSGYHSHAFPNTPTHQSLSMGSSETQSLNEEQQNERGDIEIAIVGDNENVTQPLLPS